MNSEDLAAIEKLQKRFERREVGSYSPYIKAVTDNASELISRSRRAEELEQRLEAESDYQEGQRRELSYQREQARQWEGNAIDAEKRVEELERENEVLRGIARWFYEHHTHSFYTVGGGEGRRLMGEDA